MCLRSSVVMFNFVCLCPLGRRNYSYYAYEEFISGTTNLHAVINLSRWSELCCLLGLSLYCTPGCCSNAESPVPAVISTSHVHFRGEEKSVVCYLSVSEVLREVHPAAYRNKDNFQALVPSMPFGQIELRADAIQYNTTAVYIQWQIAIS